MHAVLVGARHNDAHARVARRSQHALDREPGEVRRRGLWRRGFTGFSFAVFVSSWIFSGTVGFLSVFMMFAVVAQNEYYDMVRRNGAHTTTRKPRTRLLHAREHALP